MEHRKPDRLEPAERLLLAIMLLTGSVIAVRALCAIALGWLS